MVFYPPKSVLVASTSLSMIDQIGQKLGIPGLWCANDPDKLSLPIASIHGQYLPVQEFEEFDRSAHNSVCLFLFLFHILMRPLCLVLGKEDDRYWCTFLNGVFSQLLS